MNVDGFLKWVVEQPVRYELVAGTPIAMGAERAAHARLKGSIYRALDDAIEAAGLECEAFVDGMTVQIDEHTAYEPDVVVHCGPPIADDALIVTRPVIVVEVLSPSTRGADAGAKLDDYFRVGTVMHYLLVKTESLTVIHHARRSDGDIATRIVTEGAIELDPPGIALELSQLG